MFTLKVCDEFNGTKTIHLSVTWGSRLVPSPCLPRCLVSSCLPSFQVKLELKRWTKNKIPLNGRKIMKDASQQQPPFRNMRTQIEQECFHQDCQMIPIILPSGDIPVRTLSLATTSWSCLQLKSTSSRTKTDTEMPSQILRGYETPLWNAARDGPPSPWNGFRSYTSTTGSCLVWRIGSMRSLG